MSVSTGRCGCRECQGKDWGGKESQERDLAANGQGRFKSNTSDVREYKSKVNERQCWTLWLRGMPGEGEEGGKLGSRAGCEWTCR